MLTELEGEAFPIVERWLQPQARLTDPEKEAFAPFLAFGYTRVPRQVEIAKEQARAMGKEFARYLAEHPGTLKATVEAYERDTGEKLDIGFEDLQEAFRSFEDRFRITANEKEAQKLSLKQTLAFVPILLQMNWCLCRAARGSYFITSDAPVCPFVLERDGTAIVGAGLY